ncbi:MAG: peptide deformylase [Gammaproteobacteria bacterium]
MGDPRLLQVSQPVDSFGTAELESLIADMFDTMAAQRGAGLAAIQIGVPCRVVVFGLEHSPRAATCEPIPTTVLINPSIEPLTGQQDLAWEGCLSVPGMRGLVPRFTHIRYSGFDPRGRAVQREVSGFHARVVQHECDHLDGVLYPQRILDLRQFGFVEELDASGAMQSGRLPCEDGPSCAASSDAPPRL